MATILSTRAITLLTSPRFAGTRLTQILTKAESSEVSILAEAITSSWHLPNHLKRQLAKYYILRWSRSYFRLQPELHQDIIWHQGICYHVSYHECSYNDVTCADSKQVWLSFRCPTSAMMKESKGAIQPTVLISIGK